MLILEQFHNASEVRKEVIHPTPLVPSECFFKQSGNSIFLKPENMQLTGAYKIRSAIYKTGRLSRSTTRNRMEQALFSKATSTTMPTLMPDC